MRQVDRIYLSLIDVILSHGEERPDRTGTGTIQIPFHSFALNIEKDFPAISFKKLHFKTMLTELNWFMLGRTDIDFLRRHKCKIWDKDLAKYNERIGEPDNKDLGVVYGWFWGLYGGPHGMAERIRRDPFSRRHVYYNSYWDQTPDTSALQACHDLFEFNIHNGKLNIHFHMRSVDVGLGLPFNIASYALLLSAVARLSGYPVGMVYVSLFNVHIYKDHVGALKKRATDLPWTEEYSKISPVEIEFDIKEPAGPFDFMVDAKLIGYQHFGELKLEQSA